MNWSDYASTKFGPCANPVTGALVKGRLINENEFI